MGDELRLEDVQRATLGPDDILVVRLPHKPTEEERRKVAAHLGRWGVKALILEPGADVEVVRRKNAA